MTKYVNILFCFLILSCENKKVNSEEKQPISYFQIQNYEYISGHCNPILASYIDGRNGNLCYVATSCYGISIYCMNHLEQK